MLINIANNTIANNETINTKRLLPSSGTCNAQYLLDAALHYSSDQHNLNDTVADDNPSRNSKSFLLNTDLDDNCNPTSCSNSTTPTNACNFTGLVSENSAGEQTATSPTSLCNSENITTPSDGEDNESSRVIRENDSGEDTQPPSDGSLTPVRSSLSPAPSLEQDSGPSE